MARRGRRVVLGLVRQFSAGPSPRDRWNAIQSARSVAEKYTALERTLGKSVAMAVLTEE